MKRIVHNPYRTIGLLVGATAREQERQTRRLFQFIDAKEEPPEDYSFPVLGHLERTTKSVTEASANLNLDKDKLNAALFWFMNGNDITDPPALEALKSSDKELAREIWQKLTHSGEITKKNYSAYHNLSTLLLSESFNSTILDEEKFRMGIKLKLKLLESDFSEEIKQKATDTLYKISKKETLLTFLNSVINEIDTKNHKAITLFVKTIKTTSVTSTDEFVRIIVQKQINEIEQLIDETLNKRLKNKEKAGGYGRELYQKTKENHELLKDIIGEEDLSFISLSDKLANEILQCGITLFNHFHNTETEIGDETLELIQTARRIALGGITKERIRENLQPVEEYINQKEFRLSQNVVNKEVNIINNELEKLQKIKISVSNAYELAYVCKPQLNSIKKKLGENNELYKTLSSVVVVNSMGMIISAVNDAMKKRSDYVSFTTHYSMYRLLNSPADFPLGFSRAPEYSFEELKRVINSAFDSVLFLKGFYMESQLQTNFDKNKESIKEIYKQINKGFFFYGDTRVYYAAIIIIVIILFFIIISNTK